MVYIYTTIAKLMWVGLRRYRVKFVHIFYCVPTDVGAHESLQKMIAKFKLVKISSLLTLNGLDNILHLSTIPF